MVFLTLPTPLPFYFTHSVSVGLAFTLSLKPDSLSI